MSLAYRVLVMLALLTVAACPPMPADASNDQDARVSDRADTLPGTWEVVVGDQSRPGRFDRPTGVAVGPDGSLYIADTRNHRVQKLSPVGEPLAAWGGQGDGPGQFRSPTGLAIDDDGTLYVSDAERHDVQKLAPTGEPLARWGGEGSELGQFKIPLGIALAPGGRLYVTDGENRRVQRLGPDGEIEATWSTDDFHPTALAVAADGSVYVTERMTLGGVKTTFHARVRRYSPNGDVLETLSGVTWPEAIAIRPDGALYVADNGHVITDPFGVRRLLPSGENGRLVGGLGVEPGRFRGAGGVAFDGQGRLYVTDMENDRVQVFTPGGEPVDVWGVQAVRPTGLATTNRDTLLVLDRDAERVYAVTPPDAPVVHWSRRWRDARGIAWDGERLLVADAANHQIVGLTRPDEMTTVWGERGSRLGELDLPVGVAADSSGSVYVADTLNDRVQKLSRDGEPLAAWDVRFGAPTARPVAIAVGGDGAVYVADEFNDRVLKLDGDGALLATIGERGEGPGQLSRPVGVALAPDRTLYVAEAGNARVQTFAPDGTSLGVLLGSADAGGPLKRVEAVAVDGSGRLYVADSDAARVYRFTPAGR